MTLYDEVNLLMERLTYAWGSVWIECNGNVCRVADRLNGFSVEAPTLLEALRLAEKEIIEGEPKP